MGRSVSTRVYEIYSKQYDLFEGIFRKRLARALGRVPFRPGDRVLDVGVGTGLSLEHYPEDVSVVGVDLSEGMLQQAKKKVESGRVRAGGMTTLMQADATRLPFAEKSFDVVFMSHVVATVSDPQRCLSEALRVTRELGYVVIVNHFQSELPVVKWVEAWMDPVCRRLGWRTDLSVRGLLEPVGVKGHVEKDWRAFRILYLRKFHEGVRVVEEHALAEAASRVTGAVQTEG